MNNIIKQTGTVTLYISHGAGTGHAYGPKETTTDWFIVEPRNDPEMLAKQVQSLRERGRTVIELEVTPYQEAELKGELADIREALAYWKRAAQTFASRLLGD